MLEKKKKKKEDDNNDYEEEEEEEEEEPYILTKKRENTTLKLTIGNGSVRFGSRASKPNRFWEFHGKRNGIIGKLHVELKCGEGKWNR